MSFYPKNQVHLLGQDAVSFILISLPPHSGYLAQLFSIFSVT